MPEGRLRSSHRGDAAAFWLLAGFLVVLWAVGGASRADVAGQVVTRAAAWIALLCAIVWSVREARPRMGAPGWILAAAIALVAIQLLPLPPAVWMALPGREALVGSIGPDDAGQPWRPLSISPGGTRNALGSLVVPLAALVIAARLHAAAQWRILVLILGLVLAATIIGIVEFSGVPYDNPFLNDRQDQVNGSFANRNHMALFAVIGMVIAPAWGLRDDPAPWRIGAAAGLVTLFLLMVLATGSRSGAVLAVLALAFSALTMRTKISAVRRMVPRKLFWAGAIGGALLIVGSVFASFAMDRAVSLDRATELQATSDVRLQTLPTIIEMVGRYFPAGTGFGTFDPAYRIAEPTVLLGPQYLNEAHNDMVQIVLEGGLAGAVLLLVALVWFVRAGLRAFRSGQTLPRIGTAIIGLTILASVTDYPARTPMIMALVAIAAVWLVAPADPAHRSGASRTKALPKQARSL